MKTNIVVVLAALLLSSCAQKKPEIYSDSSSTAISGYDPVAYFTDGKPVKGRPEFSFQWKDATWLFASRQHLDSFSLHPDQFAPQYGGWCAYGCSRGKKATTDPDAWTIVAGKLYLNNSLQVKEKWMKDQSLRIQQADMNWPKIKDN